MKVRSKKLWQYLADCNLLNANEEELELAKTKYRRLYKTKWKQNRTKPEKEIRPKFSIREYIEFKMKASNFGMNPTKYLKTLALASIYSMTIAPNKDKLKKVMQLLTTAVTTKDLEAIGDAEKLLLEYLKSN